MSKKFERAKKLYAEKLYERFSGTIDADKWGNNSDEFFENFAKRFDPTGSKIVDDMTVVGDATYTEWLARVVLKNHIALEDIQPIAEDLDLFNRYRGVENEVDGVKISVIANANIDSYKKPLELFKAVEHLQDKKEKKMAVTQAEARDGSTILYKGEEGRILSINTKEASQYYGQNTRWCIAATETNGTEDDHNYFNAYHSDWKPAIFFLPSTGKEKYALTGAEGGVRNALDEDASLYNDDPKYRALAIAGLQITQDDIDFLDSDFDLNDAKDQLLALGVKYRFWDSALSSDSNLAIEEPEQATLFDQLKSKMNKHIEVVFESDKGKIITPSDVTGMAMSLMAELNDILLETDYFEVEKHAVLITTSGHCKLTSELIKQPDLLHKQSTGFYPLMLDACTSELADNELQYLRQAVKEARNNNDSRLPDGMEESPDYEPIDFFEHSESKSVMSWSLHDAITEGDIEAIQTSFTEICIWNQGHGWKKILSENQSNLDTFLARNPDALNALAVGTLSNDKADAFLKLTLLKHACQFSNVDVAREVTSILADDNSTLPSSLNDWAMTTINDDYLATIRPSLLMDNDIRKNLFEIFVNVGPEVALNIVEEVEEERYPFKNVNSILLAVAQDSNLLVDVPPAILKKYHGAFRPFVGGVEDSDVRSELGGIFDKARTEEVSTQSEPLSDSKDNITPRFGSPLVRDNV